jgi:hypothetical protein
MMRGLMGFKSYGWQASYIFNLGFRIAEKEGQNRQIRGRESISPPFSAKSMISLGKPLTEPSSITIMPRAEEIHPAKAHVVDRRRIVKRGH